MSTKELKSPTQYQNIQPVDVGQSDFYGQNTDREPSEISKRRVTHRNVNMMNYGEYSEGRPGSRYFGTIPVNNSEYAASFYAHHSRMQSFISSGRNHVAGAGRVVSLTPDNALAADALVHGLIAQADMPAITGFSEYEDRGYFVGGDQIFRGIFDKDRGGHGPYYMRINVERPTEVLPHNPIDPTNRDYGYRYIYSGIFMEGLNGPQVYIQTAVANAANDWLVIADSSVFPTGTRVQITTDTTEPPPLVMETDYYSIVVDATHIRLAIDYDHAQTGDYINITGAGVGTHRVVTLLRQTRVDDEIFIGMETGTCKDPNKEEDFGEVFFANEIDEEICYCQTISDEFLAVPFRDSLTGLIRCPEYTHYGIYRTMDIGPYHINPITGKGTEGHNTEFYIWDEDVPCCKAFSITIAGNVATITAGQIRPCDVGCLLRDSAGNTGTIDTYTSRTEFNLAAGHTLGAGATTVCLGSETVMTAAQVGTLITRTAGAQFQLTDVGKPYFWADGGMSIIIARVDANNVTALVSMAHASQAATFNPTRRGFTDSTPDDEGEYTVTGKGLKERMLDSFYMPPRFWSPIPEGDEIWVDSGHMFVFKKNTSMVYYCDIGSREWWAGQYRADHQFFVLPAECVGARIFPGMINFFCKGKTLGLALNVATEAGNEDVGEHISKLNEPTIIDDDVGVASSEHMRALVPIRQGLLIGLTDEPAVRLFDGTGWSEKNLAMGADGRGAVQKYINQLVGTGIFGSYTQQGGYILFGDFYERDGATIDTVKIALRYAIEPTQGEGWSEYRGDAWLWPLRLAYLPANDRCYGQILNFVDRAGNKRSIIAVEYIAGGGQEYALWYEHATWERGANYGPSYLDRADTDAAFVGAITDEEIETESWFGEEIVGELDEHSKFEDMVSHYGTRPQDFNNRDIAGYDESGYRDEQEFSQEVYADGALAAPAAVVTNLPYDGDIVFPGTHVEARRLLYVFKSAASEFKLTRRKHTLLPKREMGTRTERIMGETTDGRLIVDNLAYRLSRHRLPLFEYVRGAQIATTANCTLVTGPDGRARSAFQLDANINLLNEAIAGAYTLIFWMHAGVTIPALPALTQYGAASGAWTMQYVQNNNCPANVIITAGTIHDVLICDANVTAALAAIYRDVLNNAGRAFGVFF